MDGVLLQVVRIPQKRLELLEEREFKSKRHLVEERRDNGMGAKKHKSEGMNGVFATASPSLSLPVSKGSAANKMQNATLIQRLLTSTKHTHRRTRAHLRGHGSGLVSGCGSSARYARC